MHKAQHAGDTYLLQVSENISSELSEKKPEQVGQQWSCQIQPLFTEMITVIKVTTLQLGQDQSMNHVSEEVCLHLVSFFRDGDVRKGLLGQDVFRMLDTLILRVHSHVTSSTDLIEGDMLLLNSKPFLNRWSHKIGHGFVSNIVHDVPHDFLIRNYTECSENEHNGDVLTDVW